MIVAEIGVNWNWSNLGERLTLLAETGVMWVKFQIFRKDQVPEQFHDLVLDWIEVCQIKEECAKRGLRPIFTPMYLEAVAWCGSDHIKIRYKDKGNRPLIRRAEEVARNILVSGDNVFCVPKYPATFEDYQVSSGGYRGVSVHCPDIEIAKSWHRDCYIEYHVKFSEDDYEAKWSIGLDDLAKLVEWERQ